MNAKLHYESLLAPVYSWMCGNFSERVSDQIESFKLLGISTLQNADAVDLGSGHGIQSVALAKLGYSVTAVDFNQSLLEELLLAAADLPITTIENDLISFLTNSSKHFHVVVCMGDTLTHLSSFSDVASFLSMCHQKLQPDGKVIVSFRDYSTELRGDQRFIPVKSDNEKILTCFLEFDVEHVCVTDILHLRNGQKWEQRISSYHKLRISKIQFEKMIDQAGFQVANFHILRGMMHFVLVKP